MTIEKTAMTGYERLQKWLKKRGNKARMIEHRARWRAKNRAKIKADNAKYFNAKIRKAK